MNKFFQKIVAFTQTRYMKIITNGFMSVAAITIAGSIFNLILSLPIDAYQTFLTNTGLDEILSIPVACTTDIMAVYVCLSMGAQVAKEFNKDTLSVAIISLGAFMILTPFTATVYSADYTSSTVVSDVISTSVLGARGIFLAIIVGIGAARLYTFFLDKGWKIKMPDSVPESVSKMFEMMIPGGLTFLIFLAIRYGFSLTSYGTAQQFIYSVLQTPLVNLGSSVGGLVAYVIFSKVLWVFGIHGGMVTYSALAAVIGTVNVANQSAFAAGTAAPYQLWAWANYLMDAHIISLSLVMIVFAKSKQYKTLAKISLPTSVFNITEPLVFGMPIVMNPIMAIPFLGTQIVNFVLTILVVNLGIIAPATGAAFNTMLPGPILAALTNSSWTGFVWGLVIIAIDFVIWMPFFRMQDKRAVEEENACIEDGEAAVEA